MGYIKQIYNLSLPYPIFKCTTPLPLEASEI